MKNDTIALSAKLRRTEDAIEFFGYKEEIIDAINQFGGSSPIQGLQKQNFDFKLLGLVDFIYWVNEKFNVNLVTFKSIEGIQFYVDEYQKNGNPILTTKLVTDHLKNIIEQGFNKEDLYFLDYKTYIKYESLIEKLARYGDIKYHGVFLGHRHYFWRWWFFFVKDEFFNVISEITEDVIDIYFNKYDLNYFRGFKILSESYQGKETELEYYYRLRMPIFLFWDKSITKMWGISLNRINRKEYVDILQRIVIILRQNLPTEEIDKLIEEISTENELIQKFRLSSEGDLIHISNISNSRINLTFRK